MLTVGEVWGVYSTRCAGSRVHPAAYGCRCGSGGCAAPISGLEPHVRRIFLTPAAGPDGHAAETPRRCWLRLLPGRSFLPGSGHGGPWWNVRQKS